MTKGTKWSRERWRVFNERKRQKKLARASERVANKLLDKNPIDEANTLSRVPLPPGGTMGLEAQSRTYDEGYSKGMRRGRSHMLGDVIHMLGSLVNDNY